MENIAESGRMKRILVSKHPIQPGRREQTSKRTQHTHIGRVDPYMTHWMIIESGPGYLAHYRTHPLYSAISRFLFHLINRGLARNDMYLLLLFPLSLNYSRENIINNSIIANLQSERERKRAVSIPFFHMTYDI